MLPVILGIAGLLLGPFLHAWAVQAGIDHDLHSGFTCPRCGGDGNLIAIRCSCDRLRWRELSLGVAVGLTLAGVASTVGGRPVLVAHVAMVIVTAMLIVTDFDHLRIPNSLLYPGTLACLLLLGVGSAFEGVWPPFFRGLIGATIYFGLLFLVFLAARGEGFGFGDVKLAALLGLFTAFHSYRILAWALLITAFLGGIPAVILLAMGKGKKAAIPYGPPLIIGTWSAIIFSHQILG